MRARGLLPWVGAFAGYAGLTILFTWPLPVHIASTFPHDSSDPAFITWVLWWNAHAVPLTRTWWNAPMFWPAPDMFALSEHMLGISIFTTPLQWMGFAPIVAFNIAFLLSFPLSALAAHALAFTLTKRHDAGVVAALIFGFSPYRVSQMPHLQMLWVFGMPLALAALHRFIDGAGRVWLLVFAGAWLVQALANGYLMLFFPVLIGCWVVWFAARRPMTDIVAIAIAFVAGSLPLVPFLIGYERVHTHLNLERHIGEIEQFSADMLGVVAASPAMRLWSPLSRFSTPEGELFFGFFALALAASGVVAAAVVYQRSVDRPDPLRIIRRICAGIAVIVGALVLSRWIAGPWKFQIGGRVLLSLGVTSKPLTVAVAAAAAALMMTPTFLDLWRRRSALAFYAFATGLMLVLSLGPRPRLAGTEILFRAPYEWLMMLVPGFSSVRVPARFAMPALLCLAATAALAFVRLTRRASHGTRILATSIAVAIILVESWPRMVIAEQAPAIPALDRTGTPDAVLELPLGITERDIAALYRSIDHRLALVNGYSGYVPPHYLSLKMALENGDADVLDIVAAGAALTVVVDHRWEFPRWASLVERHPGHRLVADDGSWRVYEVIPRKQVESAPEGGRLPIESLTPNVGAADARFALDGNLRTNWNSRQLQSGNEEVALDLGRPREVDAVRLELGPYRYDFPRALSVECAGDGEPWQVCWSGPAAALAVSGVLADPVAAPMTIPIHRSGIRRLRLRQTAVDRYNGWSIAELAVIGR